MQQQWTPVDLGSPTTQVFVAPTAFGWKLGQNPLAAVPYAELAAVRVQKSIRLFQVALWAILLALAALATIPPIVKGEIPVHGVFAVMCAIGCAVEAARGRYVKLHLALRSGQKHTLLLGSISLLHLSGPALNPIILERGWAWLAAHLNQQGIQTA